MHRFEEVVGFTGKPHGTEQESFSLADPAIAFVQGTAGAMQILKEFW